MALGTQTKADGSYRFTVPAARATGQPALLTGRTDLAEVLPATWVPDLLGWPNEGRDRLIGRLLGLDPRTGLRVADPPRLAHALLERAEAADGDLLTADHGAMPDPAVSGGFQIQTPPMPIHSNCRFRK